MTKRYCLLLVAGVFCMGACTPSNQNKKNTTSAMQLPAFNKEGHRGTRGLMPENTIGAMRRAIDEDVHTVELDVVLSKDGQVVVSHDIYFHSDFTTTPGGNTLSKAEGESLLLYHMDYDSIRRYDVGMKQHPGFPQQQTMPAYKPLLAQLVDSTDAYARQKGKTILYNIELKANAAWDGIKTPPVAELVHKTMQVVQQKKLQHRCYLQSFDFRAMRLVKQHYPGITTAILIAGSEKRSLDEQLSDLGYTPEMYSPAYQLVTPELVAACHQKQMKIIPWTVNTLADMQRLKAMGVDGIITDYPNLLKAL